MDENREERVRQTVEGLLREGFVQHHPSAGLHVGAPLLVRDTDERPHSWFVPLQAGSKLAGFAQLSLALVPIRLSSFQRGPHDFDNCPDTADWVDPERIAARARTIARPDEQLSPPILSYDGYPDRLAWKVTARSPSGQSRALFVAGTGAFVGRGAGDTT